MSKELLKEKMFLISIVGTLEAIREGALTVDEAERFLFCPHVVKQLKRKKYNKAIINILEEGYVIEDIASIWPHLLEKNLEELKQKALEEMKKYDVFEREFWIESVTPMD